MLKELKSVIINAIITLIISAIGGMLFNSIFGNKGKVELVSSKMIDDNYQTIILIKNLQKDEYLNNIEFKVTDNIDLEEIDVDGEIKNDSFVQIDKIDPCDVVIVKIKSNKSISKNDLIIVKNGQKLEIESFNNYTNYNLRILISIIMYAIINAIISIMLFRKNNKIYLKAKEECDSLNEKIKKVYEQLNERIKKSQIQESLYIKEMNSMERENDLYRILLKEKIQSPLTPAELEDLISKKMKTIKKEKVKYFKYEDIVDIVSELVDINQKN